MATNHCMYAENNYNEFVYTTTATKERKKGKLSFYLKCINWLWKHRNWENTRQKYKAMEKECGL